MAASTDRGRLAGWRERVARLIPPPPPRASDEPRLRAGWRVIAAKELGDHVTSIRFIVLIFVIGIAAAVPLYFASARIRELAEQISSNQSVFLALFTVGPENFERLRADTFVGLFAPLLGIAFGFDAVNVERSEGTLPRLVSQPIHRDDVINGKFVAGLAVITIALVAMVLLVSGFGIARLGFAPELSEILRIAAWVVLTVIYVGFWLAFAMLLSVALRRAASSALIGFGVWVLTVLLGSLFLLEFLANLIAPIPPQAFTEEEVQAQIRAAQTQNFIKRLSPHTLYTEASRVLLIPVDPVASGAFTPATIEEIIQAQDPRRYLASRLSIDQSLLLVGPQVVGLIALTSVMFGAAYVVFMRQEIRA
ncbi:MAG TPA: ABC transporter permease subunit [Candidatus Limnocylindrales bacterium]|jgi:ABC-2 type transport system permease protein